MTPLTPPALLPRVTPAEGYVKYSCEHHSAPAPEHPDLAELDALRTGLFDAGLLGQMPDGVGFGNVSVRDGEGFVITATATGSARILGEDGYSRVEFCLPAQNAVRSRGPLPPSSEALSHHAVYAASPSARCVAHVHSRQLFDRLLAEGVPATPPDAAFGTPQLARTIAELVALRPQEGVIVTAGHEEGLIVYGPSVAAVGEMIRTLSLFTCNCAARNGHDA